MVTAENTSNLYGLLSIQELPNHMI
jgi:hypothetical protein